MTPKLENRRQHTRITLTGLTGAVVRAINRQLEGNVLDISLGGARIAVAHGQRDIAGLVQFSVDGVPATGEIVWREAGAIGIRFRQDADGAAAAVFEHVILSEFRRHAPGRRGVREPLAAGC